jgi:membrane fusion protein, copper/silver efflux system
LLTACGQRESRHGEMVRDTMMQMGDSGMMKMGDSGMAGMTMDTPMKGMAMDSIKPGSRAGVVWTCPMHPEVVRDKAGTCPICGMDLVQKGAETRKVSAIGPDDLLRPRNGLVLSSVPATGMRRETVKQELKVLGTVGYDTRRISTISARVSGRIEKLYVRYRYQHVDQGQRIMDLYSPELATGEQELLFLLKNDPGNSVLINAARQRLLLLGVSTEQLAEVERTGRASATLGVYSQYTGHIHEAGNTMPGAELGTGTVAVGTSGMTEELPVKEGMYVEKGQTVFQVFNMDRSWAVLKLYPGDAALVHKGDAVQVLPETTPEKEFTGRVDEVLPFYGSDAKALTVRVYFDNSRRDIPIGSQVEATIQPAPVMGNWLPRTAVLSLGTDPVVFLRVDGGFRAQKVVTGAMYGDQVQVLSGLRPADSVAVNAQFLVDSEDFVTVKE